MPALPEIPEFVVKQIRAAQEAGLDSVRFWDGEFGVDKIGPSLPALLEPHGYLCKRGFKARQYTEVSNLNLST